MWCHDTKLWSDSMQYAMVAIEWWCTIPVTHPNPGFRSFSSPEAPWPSPRTTLLTTRCFYHCHWVIWRNAFQTRKNHRGGIKKPSTRRHMSMKGKCKNFKNFWWAQFFFQAVIPSSWGTWSSPRSTTWTSTRRRRRPLLLESRILDQYHVVTTSDCLLF